MATINKVNALLIDLSGTLHVGSEPIQGAAEAIRRLRAAKIPFRFCSNTSKESSSALLDRLEKAGFEIYPHEVFTSLGAMRKLLVEKGIKRPYFLLSPSAEEDFVEFTQSPQDAPHDAVVVGLAPTKFSYEHLNEAFRILSSSTPPPAFLSNDSQTNGTSKQVPLFATHRARYVRSQDGNLSLGPGPFVAALEEAVGNGLKAECIGKPEKAFFEVCLRDIGVISGNVDPKEDGLRFEEVAIIGDDVDADLGGGAVELGLTRILVKTGKYRPGDESRVSPPPDAIYDSIGSLVDALLQTTNNP